jgi:hypothetical protein
MEGGITKEQLKELLAEDMETVLEEVVTAMNQARPGSIIDDSEELVREAAGEFRRRLFQKALELRSQSEAFSPSGQRERRPDSLEE